MQLLKDRMVVWKHLYAIANINGYFMLFSVLAFYIGIGNTMSLSTAYLIYMVINLYRAPFRSLNLFLQNFINFVVSCKRMEFFLDTDELNLSLLKYDSSLPRRDDGTVIEVKDANYHWGVLSNIDLKFIEEFSKVM